MTVETTLTKKQYDGDDTTGPWAIPFPLPTANNVGAVLTSATGVDTMLTYGVDFTVAKYVDPTAIGGTATTTDAVPTGAKILFYLDVDLTQRVDLKNVGYTDVELIEAMSDKLTLICQQLSRDNDRAVKIAITSGEDPDDLIDQINQDVADAKEAAVKCDAAINNLFVRRNPVMTTEAGKQNYDLTYDVDAVSMNVEVFLGGVYQIPTIDFTVPSSKVIHLNEQPAAGLNLIVNTSLSYANPDLETEIQNILDDLSALATETNMGLAQYATDAQTIEGLLNQRSIHPAGLRAMRSTQALVEAGVDDTTWMTPLKTKLAIDALTEEPSKAVPAQTVINAPTGPLPEDWNVDWCDRFMTPLFSRTTQQDGYEWSELNGVYFAASTYTGYPVANMSDTNDSTNWASVSGSVTGGGTVCSSATWFGIEAPCDRSVVSFKIRSGDSGSTNPLHLPLTFDLYIDDVFVEAFTATTWASSSTQTFTLSTPTTGQKIEVRPTSVGMDGHVAIGKFNVLFDDVTASEIAIPAGVQLSYSEDGSTKITEETAVVLKTAISDINDTYCYPYAEIDADGVITSVGYSPFRPCVGQARKGYHDRKIGTAIGTMIDNGGLAGAFTGVVGTTTTSAALNASTDPAYCGKDYGQSVRCMGAVAYSPTNDAFVGTSAALCTVCLVGSDTDDPTTAVAVSDSVVFKGGASAQIATLACDAKYRYFWVKLDSNLAATKYLGELHLLVSDDYFNTNEHKHYDVDDNEIRRVYLGEVLMDTGEVSDAWLYQGGDSCVLPAYIGRDMPVSSSATTQAYCGRVTAVGENGVDWTPEGVTSYYEEGTGVVTSTDSSTSGKVRVAYKRGW